MLGSPEHRQWLDRKGEAATQGQSFTVEAPQAIGWTKFKEFWPQDVTKEKWRSCACLICVEVESLVNTWGDIMSTVHQETLETRGAKVRSDMSRRLRVRCRDRTCPWTLPESHAESLALPFPWPSRFKNIITKPQWAGANSYAKYNVPKLFCQDNCGCGCCADEQNQFDVALGLRFQVRIYA